MQSRSDPGSRLVTPVSHKYTPGVTDSPGKPCMHRRRGSVGMIAMSVLFVLGVVVGSLQFVVGSTHRQFYHAYYNEKALALIEGVNSIARGVAQDKLSELLKKPDEWIELTDDVTGTATQLRLWEEDSTFTPTIEVKARMRSDPMMVFAKTDGAYQTITESVGAEGLFKEGNEIAGKVEIETSVEFNLKGPSNFKVPKRTVTAEYEFKRILRTPHFFRQFVLWVKNASTGSDELEKVQERAGYNQVVNNQRGEASEGALFLAPGSSPDMPLKSGNPFKNQIGYVYLGGDEPIFLNLAAGNEESDYSEKFQMYEGKSSPFYPLWRSDFTGILAKANFGSGKGGEGGGDSGGGGNWLQQGWEWVKKTAKKTWNAVKNLFKSLSDFTKVMDQLQAMEYSKEGDANRKSAGLFAYYITRKDYGYAKEWSRFSQFGFKEGPVTSSTLHLYGVKSPRSPLGSNGINGDARLGYDGGTWGPTLVMGKVYRRNLSLSGYKQRRGPDNPSGGESFEVQAGPIEFFPDMDALLKRSADPLAEGEARPLWVWDARVDWNRHEKGVNGTYFPISGYGFLGRILPQLPAFMEEYEGDLIKTWEHSLMPPKELREELSDDDLTRLRDFHLEARQLEDFPRELRGSISPLILLMWKKKCLETRRSRGVWLDKEGSPYFEELVRNFAYASYLNEEERQEFQDKLAGVSRDNDPNADYTDDNIYRALEEGHYIWQTLRGEAKRHDLPKFEDPTQFKHQVRVGKAMGSVGEFWVGQEDEGEYKGYYPFSLPDPWSNGPAGASGGGGGTGSGTGAAGGGAGAEPHPMNFQKFFEDKFGGDKQEIFDRFVRPIMTDPGRTMPYNYSMRFVYEDIKRLFHEADPGRRASALAEVAPEVRDGIGFEVEENKDYLNLEDTSTGEGVKFRRAMDDAVLEKILEKREGSETLKQGYFFMDEYGNETTKPSDASIDELYGGTSLEAAASKRMCWVGLTEADFRERFGPVGTDAGKVREVSFGNAAEVTGDFNIFSEGPTMVLGGGVLRVRGSLRINKSVGSDKPLTIIADQIVLGDGGSDQDVVQALLVTKDLEVAGPIIVKGGLIAEKWNLSQGATPGGLVLVGYDSRLKTEESFVQVIEPRISKITISGGEK